MDHDQSELRLPAALLAKASLAGNEYGWKRVDLPEVFAAAQAAGLANLGGQVQFRFSDGTCELYWQNFDSSDRHINETWLDFVARSCAEVGIALTRLPPNTELVADGVKNFAFLASKAAGGVDLASALSFVCSFASEHHWQQLLEISNRLPNDR